MKKCIRCYQEKENSCYYRHPETKDWHMTKCKECCKWYARSNRSKESDKERYHSNPSRRLYCVWMWMRWRCYNPNNHHYKRYWNKWIAIIWETFKEFKKDMYDSYVDHGTKFWFDRKWTQIDRIDNQWNYCKENCRWVTAKENANNTSRKNNLLHKTAQCEIS